MLMLTTDVDVSDGLVTNSENKATHILVKFDNPDVGVKGGGDHFFFSPVVLEKKNHN